MEQFTSINHCKNSNHQVDHQTIEGFEEWCTDNSVIWAVLFHTKYGSMVAQYERGMLYTF